MSGIAIPSGGRSGVVRPLFYPSSLVADANYRHFGYTCQACSFTQRFSMSQAQSAYQFMFLRIG
ncbi:hypothetical protein SY86_06600 [Erwinia tracheiphila]|uniref:Uncharacterized protein n=1 Tax=Erwinia tracheiphila TaxID=65700 RepID=A0A0M2KDU1_9GAMM|nr:hypothetical protein SY86_06600 [Erwinia tracheiphila]